VVDEAHMIARKVVYDASRRLGEDVMIGRLLSERTTPFKGVDPNH
jgi:hypothetical protein